MARIRSPNYPALSLPDAIERIQQVYQKQQTTPEPREVVIRHMGYNSVNGRALKALSALIKYGFLEEAGSGLRVSARAMAIIFPDPADPHPKWQAISDAARAPDLFAQIFDRWDGRPSPEALRHFLIREGFNLSAIEQVARAFYETFDLVEGNAGEYDSSEQKEDHSVQPSPAESTPPKPQTEPKLKMQLSPTLNLTKPVFDFETVSINTKIDNQEDLTELIGRLEKIKGMLPNKTQH